MFNWAYVNDGTPQQTIEEQEEEFNNVVRAYIISLLTFIVLYLCAYMILAKYHHKKERDGLYGGDEDAKAYRISFYLCTFTLAVSFGSVLMLPMSMIGNEVVHLYPHSYWVQWLNGALIHSFWKWIFFLSNLSLFILLPFSYFFTESEGFSGQRRGLMPRVYETMTVLFLLAALVFGLAVLALAFFDNDDSAQEILLLVSEYYLQYLYSFLLCVCVLFMLSACAPVGFTILFDTVGHVLVKPKLFENNDQRIAAVQMEEEALKQKLKSENYLQRITKSKQALLRKDLESVRKSRLKLERRKNASALERNLGYPIALLGLFVLTGLALFLVSFNVLKLIFIGDHELHPNTVKTTFQNDYRNINKERMCVEVDVKETAPDSSWWWWKPWSSDEQVNKVKEPVCTNSPRFAHDNSNIYSLGANSLSSFGIFGTFLEVLVIFYLMLASVVGLYNLPIFRNLRPELRETTMTKVILNCLIIQLLSSSLPVLSRVLGITHFELQGNFGKFYWLGNFYIVFAFNVIFAAATALCIVNKMTIKVRRELVRAFRLHSLTNTASSSKHGKSPSSPSSTRSNKFFSVTEQSEHDEVSPIDALDSRSALMECCDDLLKMDSSFEEDLNNMLALGQTSEGVHQSNSNSICCTPSRNQTFAPRLILAANGAASPAPR